MAAKLFPYPCPSFDSLPEGWTGWTGGLGTGGMQSQAVRAGCGIGSRERRLGAWASMVGSPSLASSAAFARADPEPFDSYSLPSRSLSPLPPSVSSPIEQVSRPSPPSLPSPSAARSSQRRTQNKRFNEHEPPRPHPTSAFTRATHSRSGFPLRLGCAWGLRGWEGWGDMCTAFIAEAIAWAGARVEESIGRTLTAFRPSFVTARRLSLYACGLSCSNGSTVACYISTRDASISRLFASARPVLDSSSHFPPRSLPPSRRTPTCTLGIPCSSLGHRLSSASPGWRTGGGGDLHICSTSSSLPPPSTNSSADDSNNLLRSVLCGSADGRA